MKFAEGFSRRRDRKRPHFRPLLMTSAETLPKERPKTPRKWYKTLTMAPLPAVADHFLFHRTKIQVATASRARRHLRPGAVAARDNVVNEPIGM